MAECFMISPSAFEINDRLELTCNKKAVASLVRTTNRDSEMIIEINFMSMKSNEFYSCSDLIFKKIDLLKIID